MKNFNEIKKELNLTNEKIAEMFNYKSAMAYSNSSAKKRIENGLTNFYNTIKMENRPTPKSPKNRFRVEINAKKAIPALGSAFSFGTMTIENLEENNTYKHYKEMVLKYGGAYVTIRENKKVYPEFDWSVVQNYEI